MQIENRGSANTLNIQPTETDIGLSSLEAAVRKQVNQYIALGFHKEVYPNIEEVEAIARYRANFTLPEGASQPEDYKGRFDVPLVVEPRLALSLQHANSKPPIQERCKTDNIQNLTEFPNTPYLVWTHNGQRYSKLSTEQTIHSLAGDEVGSPQIEVTALYLQHPEYFEGKGYKGAAVIAIGSRCDVVWATLIDAYKGQPNVSSCWLGPMVTDPCKGSRGKEIIMLGKIT